MIETVFFVSLAITFILILFLVYHFRQSFTALETKCDTMFEIINNIVTEMNNRNTLVTHHDMPENVLYTPDVQGQDEYYGAAPELPKLLVSESEYESGDDSEDESDDESEAESEDESEDESDDENDVIFPEELIEGNVVKVINVGMESIDGTISPQEEYSSVVSEEQDPDIHEGLDQENNDNLLVDKLEETTLENSPEDIPIPMDVYRKMNITALKALVIEKGYASDTTKMKKQDVLKLLETSAYM